MSRRRTVALILGLVFCLVLLGRWAMRPDDTSDVPAPVEERLASDEQRAQAPANIISAAVPEVPAKQAPDASTSGIFRGRIIDAVTREPVREFDVQLLESRSTKQGVEPPGARSFQSDDGRFEWRGIPAGGWRVFATARGYQRFELGELQIAKGEATREITMPMRPGYALRGRVYDESSGAGIGSATISFREAHVGRYESGFRRRPSVNSEQDGSFILEGLPAGRVTVEISAPDYAARELDVFIGEKSAPLEVALSAGGTVAGYLAAADGLTPAAGVVSLFSLDKSSGGSSQTGPAGEFLFKHLSAGRYRLTGRSGGLTGELDITITGNERMEGIALAMHAGHSIRGVVSGLRADELQHVQVSAYRDGGDSSFSVPVDERGAYVLPGVAPGSVRLMADVNMRRQVAKQIKMPADTDLTVNLEFPRGARLTGHVTRAGKPLSGVWLSPHSTTEQDVFLYGAATSNGGAYVIEDMPPGEYALTVGSYRSPIVEVTADTVFDIDVPGAQLSGRLIEQGGKVPIVGAQIDIWSARAGSSRLRLQDRSDHFGQFALRGLEPGDFVLTVYKPGYELYRAPIAYGTPVDGMTIRLQPAKGVEVRVREAESGKPVTAVRAVELIAGRAGMDTQLHLDQHGIGYIPSALAGSSLLFSATGYAPATFHNWNGQGLEVSLQRQPPP